MFQIRATEDTDQLWESSLKEMAYNQGWSLSMSDSVEIRFDARQGTVCVGVDRYGDEDIRMEGESEHYMVTEGVLIIDAGDRDEEHMVDLTLRKCDEASFSKIYPSEGLREITDTNNDTILIPTARRIGGYGSLEYRFNSEDSALDVEGYGQARFRAFANENLDRFEVALLLS